MKNLKFTLFVIFLALALSACQSPVNLAVSKKPGLTVTWALNNARTLLPSTYPTIATYTVVLMPSNEGPSITQSGLTTTSFSVPNLAYGTWTVNVAALDANANTVALGTATTVITTNSSNSVSVPLQYDYDGSGTGTLNLTVDWSAFSGGIVTAANLNLAQISPSNTSLGNIPLGVLGKTPHFLNRPLASGTWRAIVTLYAGPSSSAIVFVRSETIVIVNQGTTTGTIVPSAAEFSPPTLYVSNSGNDSNDGVTPASPFLTITYALSQAWSGSTVYVAPGTYSTGELFPVTIPAGVSLIGNVASKGIGTVLQGEGLDSTFGAVVLPGKSSSLEGFVINNSGAATAASFHMGVIVDNNNTGVTVLGCTIHGVLGQAIYVNNGGNGLFDGNILTGNGYGIGFTSGAAPASKVQNNVITGNGYGIELDSYAADLGGGAPGSVGNNILANNSPYDLWSNAGGGLTITAQHNQWTTDTTQSIPANFSGENISTGAATLVDRTLGSAYIAVATYYVNNSIGNDIIYSGHSATYAGGSIGPFRTITKALSVAASGSTINVAPGTYVVGAPGVGETFPIMVPSGVSLIGDETGKGTGTPGLGVPTTINGPISSGSVLIPGANSVVAGFVIGNSANNPAVTVGSTGATLRNSTVTGLVNGTAIEVATGSGQDVFDGLVLTGNNHGIAVTTDAGTGDKVQNCTITGNLYGIELDANVADLGGGTQRSLGGNTIQNNTSFDVWSTGNGLIFAENNSWTSYTFTTIASNTADNIYMGGNASIDRMNGQ